MLYIFLAVALLASLTYFFTRDSQSNISTQNAGKIAQELYVQANLIRSAIVECTLTHPEGGGDIAPLGTPDGTIDAADNPNPPYPLNPSDALTKSLAPVTTHTSDDVRNLACLNGTTTPASKILIFQGSANQGRYLPPKPGGWSEWLYDNDAVDGVSITITPPASAEGTTAATILAARFNQTLCQATWSGSGNFVVWIQKKSCP